MIGVDLKTEIVGLFAEDITSFLSILQISKKLNKAYPYIHKVVSKFLEEEILKKTTIGNAHLCTINLHNEETIILLSLYELQKKKQLLKTQPTLNEKLKLISEIKKEVPIQTALYSNKKIILVTNNQFYKKTLDRELTKDFVVYTKEEFQEQLLSDSSIIHAHTLLYQYEKYYETVGEIEQELKIKYSLLAN